MEVPVQTKPAFWGVVAGAVALAVVGFTWGGWVTGSTAEANASQRASAAVVSALAPFCVDRFQGATDATGKLAALKGVDAWARGEMIEKGGWATMPGTNAPDQVTAVARACATLLAPA
jgi:hypothetical protein